jgi:hypothetical protein
MKKFIVLLAAVAAIAAVVAGNAFASTGTYGKSGLPGGSGNGTQVGHINTSYVDPLYGPVSCTGVNQVKNGAPAVENFTCTSTTGSPLNPAWATPGAPAQFPWGWYSDFNGAYTTHIRGAVSADGMSYSATATYN